MALVSVGVVTWNSEAHVERCVRAVRAQTHRPIDVHVADNASTDGTRAVLASLLQPGELTLLERNSGFAGGHNVLIRASRGAYYLALNPDVVLHPEYVARLVDVAERDSGIGSLTGKLRRASPAGVLDSTGMVMRRSIRHLDRGADETDRGQFDREEDVFGASGAAALYRRAMLDDVCIDGEWFDEDFFAYREDADLAWRAQWRGWRCRYVPTAVATHERRVTPERRASLPADVNRWSVRNRFLLRLKNQSWRHALRFAVPSLVRDAQVVGYVLLRERTSLPAVLEVVRLFPRTVRKRRVIMSSRRAAEAAMAAWFS
jgi:GT2 family glycosyltransferase